MIVQLGQLLVRAGVLTQNQVEAALLEQTRTGQPLGLICEERFNVDPDAIETAWAEQYAQITRSVDPRREAFEPHALEYISRRQAWQFSVLPIRFDDAELMLATTSANLRRALRFANNVLRVPSYYVLAERQALAEALREHYPITGMTEESLGRRGGRSSLIRSLR